MDVSTVSSNVAFEQALTDFSLSIYGAVNKAENDFISPYSISAALLLLMMGTDGTTKKQMMSSIFKNGQPSNVHQSYKVLNNKLLNNENGVTLAVANRLFGSKTFLPVILDSYTSAALQYYGSDMQLLDFGLKPEQSRQTINDWVSRKTTNKVKDIIPTGVLDANTVLVLANAIYFKGTWKTQFNPKNTSQQRFDVNPRYHKKVDMMHGKFNAGFGTFRKLKCRVLELPYTGDKLSMVIILPNKRYGLASLEKQLTKTTLDKLVSRIRKTKIDIRIPKFIVEAKYDLIPILKRLGFTEIFKDNVADFSKMASLKGLYVSDARHKTFIEVNEEGTEAAAATTIVTTWKSGTPRFTADHPFLFIIRDKQTGTILFMGRITQP